MTQMVAMLNNIVSHITSIHLKQQIYSSGLYWLQEHVKIGEGKSEDTKLLDDSLAGQKDNPTPNTEE